MSEKTVGEQYLIDQYSVYTAEHIKTLVYDPWINILMPIAPGLEDIYREEMEVVLIRSLGVDVPVGAQGRIIGIERPVDDFHASPNFFKGRTIIVEFDVHLFELKISDEQMEAIRKSGIVAEDFPIHEYFQYSTAAVRPDDIVPKVTCKVCGKVKFPVMVGNLFYGDCACVGVKSD